MVVFLVGVVVVVLLLIGNYLVVNFKFGRMIFL